MEIRALVYLLVCLLVIQYVNGSECDVVNFFNVIRSSLVRQAQINYVISGLQDLLINPIDLTSVNYTDFSKYVDNFKSEIDCEYYGDVCDINVAYPSNTVQCIPDNNPYINNTLTSSMEIGGVNIMLDKHQLKHALWNLSEQWTDAILLYYKGNCNRKKVHNTIIKISNLMVYELKNKCLGLNAYIFAPYNEFPMLSPVSYLYSTCSVTDFGFQYATNTYGDDYNINSVFLSLSPNDKYASWSQLISSACNIIFSECGFAFCAETLPLSRTAGYALVMSFISYASGNTVESLTYNNYIEKDVISVKKLNKRKPLHTTPYILHIYSKYAIRKLNSILSNQNSTLFDSKILNNVTVAASLILTNGGPVWSSVVNNEINNLNRLSELSLISGDIAMSYMYNILTVLYDTSAIATKQCNLGNPQYICNIVPPETPPPLPANGPVQPPSPSANGPVQPPSPS